MEKKDAGVEAFDSIPSYSPRDDIAANSIAMPGDHGRKTIAMAPGRYENFLLATRAEQFVVRGQRLMQGTEGMAREQLDRQIRVHGKEALMRVLGKGSLSS